MKSLTSKTLFVAAVAICLSLNLQAKSVNASVSDTTKKSKMKMDKMETKKMDKKMEKKKMAKDTGKMSKMSKM